MSKVSMFSLGNFKRKPIIEKFKQEKCDLNGKYVRFWVIISAVKSEI